MLSEPISIPNRGRQLHVTGERLYRKAQGRDRWLGLIMIASLAMLLTGLAFPTIRVTSLFLFETEYSIIRAGIAFLEEGKLFLFLVIAVFAIAFPLAKIAFSLWLFYAADPAKRDVRKAADGVLAISKWSMLDVFVIALVVLVLEGRLLTTANIGSGLILFAAAVILSSYALRRIVKLCA